jgi:hypothetical protein
MSKEMVDERDSHTGAPRWRNVHSVLAKPKPADDGAGRASGCRLAEQREVSMRLESR